MYESFTDATGTHDGAMPGATASDNMNSQNGASKDEADDFSTPTEQVEGVAEADIVKTGLKTHFGYRKFCCAKQQFCTFQT